MNDVLLQSEALTQARVDIAALEVQVSNLSQQLSTVGAALAELTRTVNSMRDQLTEAKGGWRTLMLLGGASATFGGFLVGFLDHFKVGQ